MNLIKHETPNSIVERVMLKHTLIMLSMTQEGLPSPVVLVGDTIRAVRD